MILKLRSISRTNDIILKGPSIFSIDGLSVKDGVLVYYIPDEFATSDIEFCINGIYDNSGYEINLSLIRDTKSNSLEELKLKLIVAGYDVE